jgi:hypothetical protein
MRPDPFVATILNATQWGSHTEPARSPDFERYKRFTLGSALMGDGFYSLDTIQHSNLWWEPEYDNGGHGRGYLGYPTGAYQRILEPTGPEKLTNSSFTAGIGGGWFWGTWGNPVATLSLDTSEYHTAPAAARIHVQSAPAGSYFKLYSVSTPFQNLAGYTLSFWAKASREQNMLVQIYSEQCPNTRCTQDRTVHIGTEWTKHEMTFLSSGTSLAPGINLYVMSPGTVWIDDVSLRDGDTSLYRRDFDRGIVVVNYTTEPQTVDLGGTFYHLDAPGWPLYDGAAVTQETILPSDARILLRAPTQSTDAAPPALRTRLDANQPNPFNPTTRIAFELARPGRARLAVYDVAGRLVRVLVDGEQPAGEQAATWDGRNTAGAEQASGVYIYRLTTSDFERSRRMTLIR